MVHWLCHQTHELVGGECEHAEHAVAHHFRGATDPDMATAELVLETAIDALTRRTLVVANLLGVLVVDAFGACRSPGPEPLALMFRLMAARAAGSCACLWSQRSSWRCPSLGCFPSPRGLCGLAPRSSRGVRWGLCSA